MQIVHLPPGRRTEDVIRAAQDSGDTVLVPWGTFCQLGNELGGQSAAKRWLRELVATTGHPIAYSVPSCDSAAEAHVFTPPDWSTERALGWVDGFHEQVEAMLGATSILHEQVGGPWSRTD